MQKSLRFVCLLLALLVTAPAHAAEGDAREVSDVYAEAVSLLLDGRLDDARAALEQIAAQSPEHAGAWLDLAILQCNLGHADEALALFDAIQVRFDPPPAIRELIGQYRSQGCVSTRETRHARLRLGRGHDSNANQGALSPNFTIGSGSSQITLVLAPEFAPRSDGYTTAVAELALPVAWTGGNLITQLQSRRYDALRRFDVDAFAAAIDHPWRWGDWEFDSIGLASLTTLGGKNYQDRFQIQLNAQPRLALPPGWRMGISGSAARIAYPTLRGYDSNQYEATTWMGWSNEDVLLKLSMGGSTDQAGGGRAGGDRNGLSLGLNARLRLPVAMTAELDWTRQLWRDDAAYSPLLIDRRRRQDTAQLRAALFVPLIQHQGVFIEYRTTRNQENISLFEYRSHQLQISWQSDFSF